jgi:hypothetical protein
MVLTATDPGRLEALDRLGHGHRHRSDAPEIRASETVVACAKMAARQPNSGLGGARLELRVACIMGSPSTDESADLRGCKQL